MFKYIALTIKHKWNVFLAGLKLRVPLHQLIMHDWSKFRPTIAMAYQRQFFGDKGDPEGFAWAWLEHQNLHRHHWEFWIPRTSHCRDSAGEIIPLRMPDRYVREMIADWLGASKAYDGYWPVPGEWKWAQKNLAKVFDNMHPDSRKRAIEILSDLGYHEDLPDDWKQPLFQE